MQRSSFPEAHDDKISQKDSGSLAFSKPLRSLDDIAAAIESYCQAVRMDPSLHVCFANLATLYMYLEDFQKAEARPRGEMMIDTDHGRRRRFPTTALVVLLLMADIWLTTLDLSWDTVFTISTGAGFFPSTVLKQMIRMVSVNGTMASFTMHEVNDEQTPHVSLTSFHFSPA